MMARDLDELNALYEIMARTADATGQRFFSELVQSLANSLTVRCSFVSVFTTRPTIMRMLAFWDGEKVVNGIEYDMTPTPCSEVAKGKIFHCHKHVRERFPDDPHVAMLGAESYRGVPMTTPSGKHVGHVGVVDIKPMAEEPRFVTLMQIFATRTSAELDRVDAETARAGSERRLNAILHSATDVIINIDDQRQITLFNGAAARVFGATRDRALGTSIEQFLTPPLRDELRAHIADDHSRDRKQWLPQGLQARRADGTAFPIDGTVSRVCIDDRMHYTLILRDITERLAAEAQIEQLERDKAYLSEALAQTQGSIIGDSEAMGEVRTHIELVAGTDANVLVLGESGTGKELVAREIHARSGRSDRPLVKVDCASLPASLIESELFGHEKGSFTSAMAQRIGRFEMADKGTIFLDEIGELPLDLQPKLLRILQDQEFERVGSSVTRKVDVRIIAATNRDLQAQIADRLFRDDLYYRLMVFPIQLPPLRQRTGDVERLARFFLERYAIRIGRDTTTITDAAMAALRDYPWPGNVRELQSVIERAVILSTGAELNVAAALGTGPVRAQAPEPVASPVARTDAASAQAGSLALKDVEHQHIVQVLKRTGWVIEGPEGAARLLQLKPSTLRSRMRKLGISRH